MDAGILVVSVFVCWCYIYLAELLQTHRTASTAVEVVLFIFHGKQCIQRQITKWYLPWFVCVHFYMIRAQSWIGMQHIFLPVFTLLFYLLFQCTSRLCEKQFAF